MINLLIPLVVGAFSIFQTYAPPVVASPASPELDIGAGGFLRGIDVQYDGTNSETILTRTDTAGAYIWNATTSRWQQLVTTASMPAGDAIVDNMSGVLDIRSAPSNTNTLYMSWNGYVYKSTNRGAAWTRTAYSQCASDAPNASPKASNGGVSQNGPFMAVDPVNPSVVYAACISGDTKVTFDGGSTWANAPGVATANGAGAAILFDSSGGTTGGKTNNVYIIDGGTGVYRSTNAGTSFALTSGGPTNFTNAAVAAGNLLVCPNDGLSDFVWFNGSAWATVSGSVGNCQAIAVNPSNTNEVVAMDAAGRTSISTTGPGGTQSGVQSYAYTFTATDIPWLGWAQLTGSYADVGQIAFDPITFKLIVTGGIGVWATTPSWSATGINAFTSMSVGIEQLVSRRIRTVPGGPPIYNADDRPVWYLGNYNQFPSTYGPGFNAVTSAIHHGYDTAYQPGNPAHLVGIFENDSELSGYSFDGGQTWAQFAAFPGGGFAGTGKQGGSIAIDSAGNIVWSPCNDYPYLSQDGGLTWKPLNGASGTTNVGSSGGSFANYLNHFSVTADKVSATTFYQFRTDSGFWKSTDGGLTWTNVNATAPTGSGFNSQLEATPEVASLLFFTSGPQTPGPHPINELFYYSADGGTTLSTVGGNAKEVRSFGFGRDAPGYSAPSMYIVGWVNSVYGIWESDNATTSPASATWTQVDTWPEGSFDNVVTISGNLNVYGEYLVGFGGSGAAYGHTAGYVARPVVYAQTPVTTTSGATIGWKTTEAASYAFNYGLTTSYGTQLTGGSASSQSVSISGLSNYTTYHFNIVATDAGSNSFTAYDETFTTLNSIGPNAPSGVAATNVNNYSNSLTWTNNQGSDPQAISGTYVYRSTGGAYSLIATLGAVTSYTDASAVPSTTYTYKIASFDASNNVSAQSSASNSATTAAGSVFAITAQPATAVVGNAGSTATWTSQSFGAAVAGRRVCAGAVVQVCSGGNATNAMTEAGNPMTKILDDGGSPAVTSMWCAADATNASGNVTLTVSGTNCLNKAAVTVFTTNDAVAGTNPTPVANGFTTGPFTQSPVIPSNGAALTCLGSNGSGSDPTTFSGGGFNALTPQQDSTNALTIACAASYVTGSQTETISGWNPPYDSAGVITSVVHP